MKALFINVPSRPGVDTPPFGILAVGSAACKAGHNVKILDFGYLTEKEIDEIDQAVSSFQPDVIGFGGITASYKGVKHISFHLNEKFPDIPLVAGGVLTSTTDLLLNKTKIQICFHGEAEYSFLHFLEKMEKGHSYEDSPGISFLKNGQMVSTPQLPQENNLDVFGIPEYHLVDIRKYLTPMSRWVKTYYGVMSEIFSASEIEEIIKKYPFALNIQTARGCTHRCTFCYRHMRGIRQQSVEFVVKHIQYLIDHYNVRCFVFGDELTTVTRKWVMAFCDAVEKLDIMFMLYGVRSDKLDEELVKRLKEVGCVNIQCGFESGSDEILKYIKKGTTREDNFNAATLLRKYKITNVPEMIIGFPVETKETIDQSVSFLKEIDANVFSFNYVLPLPETPLWDYCIKNSLITDVESFILKLSNAANLQVNMTKMPDAWLFRQYMRVCYKVQAAYYWKRFNIRMLAYVFIKYRIYQFLPKPFKKWIGIVYRKISPA